MNQTQIRRNVIARRQGQHLHSYAQVLLGWRGTMACEFERESGNIGHGTVAIVPDNAPHFYNGLSEDSELLVIDLAPADPYIQALEQACNLSLKESVFQQPYFLDLGTESQSGANVTTDKLPARVIIFNAAWANVIQCHLTSPASSLRSQPFEYVYRSKHLNGVNQCSASSGHAPQ